MRVWCECLKTSLSIVHISNIKFKIQILRRERVAYFNFFISLRHQDFHGPAYKWDQALLQDLRVNSAAKGIL